jgi:hypothetical protein
VSGGQTLIGCKTYILARALWVAASDNEQTVDHKEFENRRDPGIVLRDRRVLDQRKKLVEYPGPGCGSLGGIESDRSWLAMKG